LRTQYNDANDNEAKAKKALTACEKKNNITPIPKKDKKAKADAKEEKE